MFHHIQKSDSSTPSQPKSCPVSFYPSCLIHPLWSSWGQELYLLKAYVLNHFNTLKCYFLKSFWPGHYQCAFSPLSFVLLFICTGPYPYLVFICILNFLFFIVFSLKKWLDMSRKDGSFSACLCHVSATNLYIAHLTLIVPNLQCLQCQAHKQYCAESILLLYREKSASLCGADIRHP